jgi:hypothetical protein
MRALLVFILFAATSTLAIAPGGKLYVSAKDTALLKEPKEKAAKLATLAAGIEVTWLGASDKDPAFHQVDAGGKKGFVHRSSLTPNKPQSEFDAASGKPMSPQAFAASGAAVTKGPYGPPSSAHYKGDPAQSAAAAELIYLDALNKQAATPEALAQKNKELHSK